MEDDDRKAHDEEVSRKKQMELAHAKKLAMAKQEVKKRQTLMWATKPKVGAPVLHTSLRKEQRSTSPMKVLANTALSKASLVLSKESP